MLSKKDALHFIANLMSKEEAVGEVSPSMCKIDLDFSAELS